MGFCNRTVKEYIREEPLVDVSKVVDAGECRNYKRDYKRKIFSTSKEKFQIFGRSH